MAPSLRFMEDVSIDTPQIKQGEFSLPVSAIFFLLKWKLFPRLAKGFSRHRSHRCLSAKCNTVSKDYYHGSLPFATLTCQ